MKNTLDLLRFTLKIMESWEAGPVTDIERDTVLENLRSIYSGVKYADCVNSESHCTCEPDPIPVSDEPAEQSVPQPEPCPTPPQPVEVELQITENPPVPQPQQSGAEEGSCIVNSEDETTEFAENILFEEAEIPVKPKLDKKVILSLYGDEPVPLKARQEETPAETAPEVPVEPRPAVQAPVAQSPADAAEPVQVLGDVLSNGNQTVGDVYSEQNTKTDVASVIGSGKVESLRKAIGINDKFLIIRNLFDGNAGTYDEVISTLDGFGDLDDALIYITENFNWNPDNEAVKMIVDLLTRKFS